MTDELRKIRMTLKQLLITGLVFFVSSYGWSFGGSRSSAVIEDSDSQREREKVSLERQMQQLREESAVLLRNVEVLREEDREPVRKLLSEIRNLVGPFSTRGQVLKGQGQTWEERRSLLEANFLKASRKLQMAKSRYGRSLDGENESK